jgi:hypothetical protein
MPYTASELIAAARSAGYDLTEQEFKDLGRKGRELFPPPRRLEGKRGIWNDGDLNWLLDLLWLRARRNNAESIRLGLWLHGYPVNYVTDMLVAQVDSVQEELIGTHDVSADSDAPFEHLNEVLEGFTRFSELAYGTELLAYADVATIAQETGQPTDTLRRLALPIRGPDGSITYPRQDVLVRDRDYVLRDAVSNALLIKTGLHESPGLWSLPAVRHGIETSSIDALNSGRGSALFEFAQLLNEFDEEQSHPHIAYKGVKSRELWEEHGQNMLHYFSTPELLPLTALMIGSTPSVMRRSVVRHLHLLALAMDRLLKTRGARPKKREALLTLLFSFEDLPEEAR